MCGWLFGADFDDAGVEEVDGFSHQRVLGEGWVDWLRWLVLRWCALGEFGCVRRLG